MDSVGGRHSIACWHGLIRLAIRLRFVALDPVLDERGRRRFAAAEARARDTAGSRGLAGHGDRAQHDRRALAELRGGDKVDAERVRRAGGGRKPPSETDRPAG